MEQIEINPGHELLASIMEKLKRLRTIRIMKKHLNYQKLQKPMRPRI